MPAAIIDLPANVGYAAVFALIAVETMGIPVPGETALIGAALLAHDGQMSIGLGVYFLGHVAEEVISTVGPAAAVASVLALVSFLVWRHRRAAA